MKSDRSYLIVMLVAYFSLFSGWVVGECPTSDLNDDCVVDFADLMIFADQWLDVRDYPSAGLAGFWKMDEASGSVLIDGSGNMRNGTAVNMVSVDRLWGRFGKAVEFDGVDDYVEIAGYEGIIGSGARTCTAWIRTGASENSLMTIMSWGNEELGGRWKVITNNVGALHVLVLGGWISGTTDLRDDQWHHVAVVLDDDGSADISEAKLYVDGQIEPISGSLARSINTGDTSGGLAANDVRIGAFYLPEWEYPFKGMIGEVRIYDRALSVGQIAELGMPGADMDGRYGVDGGDLAKLAGDWMKEGSAEVRINEIHYDPDVKTQLAEFVELYNSGSAAADLSGWYFSSGFTFKFPAGSVIPAGGYKVIAQNGAGFEAKFGFPADGVFEGKLENDGETVRLRDADGRTVDAVDYKLGFPWPTVGEPVAVNQPGTGYSIQLASPAFDNDLGGNWSSALPTPKAVNSVVVSNVAPQMRQVKHSPKSPVSGEAVTVTAKVTDPEGVDSVSVKYQIVAPGSYISISDSIYNTSWSSPISMVDDGTGADEKAGDDIYTAVLPVGLQAHRRLIRYRVTAVDNTGLSITAPYADDPCPNFAYFVYDGVPSWTGAIRPGVSQPVTYGTDVMRSLPVYHLVSKKSDVERATWLDHYGGSDYKWNGTLVYDGEVYDHIRYRARGGVWRYAMGKNMWKFDFNRGHYFQARDDYGKKYNTKWDKLNFSACIQQGSFGQRGEQGMFEAVSFKMFDLAGSPSPNTNWLHFRIVDELYEDGAFNAAHAPLTTGGTQYDGDFWGLYMAIEQMDGRFLEEHGLGDGNLYKMENGTGTAGGNLNNQGPTHPTDNSDLVAFKTNGFETSPSQGWWTSHVNLDHYYPYYAVYQAIHHGDITHKNHFFYNNPDPVTNEWGTNYLWSELVWDLDLTWTTYYGSSNPSDPLSRKGLLGHSAISIRNRNFTRHFNDLFFGNDQVNQLIDEFAAIIDPPGAVLSMADADRAMWDYHWVMGTGAYPTYLNRTASTKAGQDMFYKSAQNAGFERSFEGMVDLMKRYVVQRRSHMTSLANDSQIPHTPVISYIGEDGEPINDLRFGVSPYGDPQGAGTFKGMEWRIAEVEPFSIYVPPTSQTVLVDEESRWRYFKGTKEPSTVQGAWREEGFDDDPGSTDWAEGNAPIGYDRSIYMGTPLNDMSGNYSTFYLRKEFEVSDLDDVGSLKLYVKYDDGFNAWINGHYVKGDNVSAEELPHDFQLRDAGYSARENSNFVEFSLPDPKDYLVEGTNVIAVQVLNVLLSGSSDCFADIRLIGEPAGGEEPGNDPVYLTRAGKYEITPVWESGEVGSFNSEIGIPASVVRVGRTYRVRARMKDNTDRWSHWSGPYQFVAGEPKSANILTNLRITEVMYNPAGKDGREFIELKNFGDEVIDLSGVSFESGITFGFGGTESSITSVDPGEFVLVVRDKGDFEDHYGTGLSSIIAGEYGNLAGEPKLSNSGENIQLVDMWNGTVAEFDYNDARGWPASADGGGHSLVALDSALVGQPNGSCRWWGNWRASTNIDGSPGADDPAPISGVVINEVMAHTDYSGPSGHDSNDWIELFNSSGSPVTINGDWYLSDDVEDLKKWSLPDMVVEAGEFVSFDEVTGFNNPLGSGFGLNKAGETVVLSYLPGTGQDRIADYVDFKGQANFVSWGRYPDGGAYWFTLDPTKDVANAGPVLGAVISEVMYHPVDDDSEYIELYNPTNKAISLSNSEGPWEIDGAVEYAFDVGMSIGAKERIVIVPFDPAVDTADLDAFNTAYDVSLVAGADVFGPWSGSLSNGGERVTLEWREPVDLPGPGQEPDPNPPTPWVIADEVIYGDYDPWPNSADGKGEALERISMDSTESGNDPSNWRAATPSPGE